MLNSDRHKSEYKVITKIDIKQLFLKPTSEKYFWNIMNENVAFWLVSSRG